MLWIRVRNIRRKVAICHPISIKSMLFRIIIPSTTIINPRRVSRRYTRPNERKIGILKNTFRMEEHTL